MNWTIDDKEVARVILSALLLAANTIARPNADPHTRTQKAVGQADLLIKELDK